MQELFDIENSFEFKLFKFISNNLDYLFRYMYAICYLYFLCSTLAKLYNVVWLSTVSVVVFIVLIFGWVLAHIIMRMRKSNLKFFEAIKFYLRGYCIMPKEKKKKRIDDELDIRKKRG